MAFMRSELPLKMNQFQDCPTVQLFHPWSCFNFPTCPLNYSIYVQRFFSFFFPDVFPTFPGVVPSLGGTQPRHLRLHRFEQGVMEERNQRDKEVQEKKARKSVEDGEIHGENHGEIHGENHGEIIGK